METRFLSFFVVKLKQIHIDKGITAGYSTNIPQCSHRSVISTALSLPFFFTKFIFQIHCCSASFHRQGSFCFHPSLLGLSVQDKKWRMKGRKKGERVSINCSTIGNWMTCSMTVDCVESLECAIISDFGSSSPLNCYFERP